ncbi:hypothetical protein [Rufibacter roseus]|uniref:Uncharacterized protein n=1 Tax=Rufibacter roseus TaxID=1567108 RepID=A0ABW2DQ98_9BACT|nr:hypothetical protein [Rufibacter roseus]
MEFEKELPLGNYRVRIYSINLGSVDVDEGDDYYRIEVWRGQPLGKKLLKEYKNHYPTHIGTFVSQFYCPENHLACSTT